MRALFIFCILIGNVHLTIAQEYFQQKVDYKIKAHLDDVNHRLKAEMSIDYYNYSPDTLPLIEFNLWPNAYSNKSTDFAEQQIQNGSSSFYFASQEDLGGFDKLTFQTKDGKSLELEPLEGMADCGRLLLPAALLPGEMISFNIDFELDIPASFSRLGHVGQSYQLTQWYPKPAVYDRNGWHSMPYLDMGEFYSEFGDVELELSLPDNYWVGASGVLQTQSEIEKIEEASSQNAQFIQRYKEGKVELEESNEFPESSKTYKTLTYRAENVHDFAWFADKRFKIQKSAVQLASGKKVDTYVLYTRDEEELWMDAITYVNRSVAFYSEVVGEYPWPQATALQSALSAGGGMEYPMVTVIGLTGGAKGLDRVITHEVGHNWFYGILGSNERDHVWMDEGVNSYYEGRYMERYYPKTSEYLDLPPALRKSAKYSDINAIYQLLAKRHALQRPSMDAQQMSQLSYFIGGYIKVPILFQYLEKYVGVAAVDEAIQAYYQEWKFKHPQPNDLQRSMEQSLDMDLGWIFQSSLAKEGWSDYRIQSYKEGVLELRNKGEVSAPVYVVAHGEDGPVDSLWIEGFKGQKKIPFEVKGAKEIHLDPQYWSPENNRTNQIIRTNGVLKKWRAPSFRLATGIQQDNKADIYFLPLPSYNLYDKFQLGMAFHNYQLPQNRFRYFALPLYSFGQKELVGLADFSLHNYFSKGWVRDLELGLNLKRFHFDRNESLDYTLNYYRIVPKLSIHFNVDRSKTPYSFLNARFVYIGEEAPDFDEQGTFLELETETRSYLDLVYEWGNDRVVNPIGLMVNYRQSLNYESNVYSKLSASLNYAITYKKSREISFRLFAGTFLSNDKRESLSSYLSSFQLSGEGHYLDDELYDENYIGRNANDGSGYAFWGQQIYIRDAGFKNPLGPSVGLGNSNNFMLALNTTLQLPYDIPILNFVIPYWDMAYSGGAENQDLSFEDRFYYAGGLEFRLPFQAISFYFPLVASSNIQEAYKAQGIDNLWKKVSFMVRFNLLNPDRIVEKIGY